MRYVAAVMSAALLCVLSFFVMLFVFAAVVPPSIEELIRLGSLGTSAVLAGLVGLLAGAYSYRATLKHYERMAPPAPEAGNSAPEAPAQPTKAKPKQYSCCLAALVVLVIVGAVFFVSLFREKQEMAPRCEKYLNAVERGDYRTAYRSLGRRSRELQTHDEYVEFKRTLREALGKCQEKTLTQYKVRAGRRSTGLVVYHARFEKGECQIVFTLEKEDGNWRVQGVNYNSPALLPIFKCPHCGTIQKGLAKFCSQCGKPMKPKTAPPEAEDDDGAKGPRPAP
ncbi:MAG: DUF4019 domain-containing protein [Planctomycetota bacterium]